MGTEIRITYFCEKISSHNYVATLTKVGFDVCLVRSTIYVYNAVKVVSAPLVSVCTSLFFLLYAATHVLCRKLCTHAHYKNF